MEKVKKRRPPSGETSLFINKKMFIDMQAFCNPLPRKSARYEVEDTRHAVPAFRLCSGRVKMWSFC